MDFHVIGVGEVLWDLLLTGPQLGGAPANFAYHAHALGARAQVITRVGNDDYGREIIRRFHDMGLRDTAVQVDDTAPTGIAKVELSGNGLAHFTIQENVAWDRIALTRKGRSRLRMRRTLSALAVWPSVPRPRAIPFKNWLRRRQQMRCACLTSICGRSFIPAR